MEVDYLSNLYKKIMADIAARREARRRKILENSQNRLKLITGDQNGSITVPEPQVICPKVQNIEESQNIEPSVEDLLQTIKQSLQNHVHDGLLSDLLPENVSLSSGELLNFPENVSLSSLVPEEQVPSKAPNTSSRSADYSKIYVICLAIIIRLLFIFQMQFCVRDSITLPFIIFQLTLQYFNRNAESSNAFFNTLLLFSNLPPRRVKLIIGILKSLEHFSTAFCLYFFTFMVVHVLLDFFII